jgi:hypothetical protein
MAEITLHVEVPQNVNTLELAQQIQERLAALDEVDEVEAAPESTRLAAEIIAGIAVTVSIIKGAAKSRTHFNRRFPRSGGSCSSWGCKRRRWKWAGNWFPSIK